VTRDARGDGGRTVPPEERSGPAEDDQSTEPPTGASFVGEGLVLRYPGAETPVVDGETIRVPPGEVTALVGPNGSGKSTLLKGLADQIDRQRGSVLVDGTAVDDLSSKALARRVGLLSQENVAPDSVTVETLVEHGRYPHRGPFAPLSEADRAAVERAMERAGVEHLRDRDVGSLSGGQAQLVWIALSLAQQTDVLLLDEPTTFLDLRHQLEVMDIVETLRDESDRTVVVVVHDVQQAARRADHVVALDDGAIYDHGPPEDVVTEGLLADVFGVEATVEWTDRGPQITPLGALDEG